MNVRQILEAVCAFHGITPESVLAKTRSTLHTVVRQQTIVLAREFTCASIFDIGFALDMGAGNSLVYERRRHAERMEDAQSPYARSFRAIRNDLQKRV